MKTILLLDRDAPRGASLHEVLYSAGFKVIAESDRHFMLFLLATDMPVDLVIMVSDDVDGDCHDFLRSAKQVAPFVRVVVLTKNRSVFKYLQVLSLGAYKYISGPVEDSEIVQVVHTATEIPEEKQGTAA